jgi:hypothetical protein
MTGTDKRGLVVQGRDNHLFLEIFEMGVVDREQAKCVGGFGSTTRVNARLLALTREGLLRRFYLGTDGSGQKALYSLSLKGANLVQVPYRGLRRGRDETLVADFAVMHQLRINGLYCLLKYRPIPVEGANFLRWESFHQPIDTGKALIPDGYVEIAVGSTVIAAFLEVDLGHEGRTVWQRKVENYREYAASGEFTKRFARPQFRTLVVTGSEKRMNSLRDATAKITEKIFWFTTYHSVANDGLWSPIWRRVTGDTRQPLL